MEDRYQLVLAVWKLVKINLGVSGTIVDVEGFPSFIRQALHKDDYLAFSRSKIRKILLLIASKIEICDQRLEDFDISLFNNTRFSTRDDRLTSVTYNDGKHGTITTFQVTTEMENGRPIKIRPEAAMMWVPKIVLQKFCTGAQGSRTELQKMRGKYGRQQSRNGQKIEKSTVLRKLVPDAENHEGGQGDPKIGGALKLALSMGSLCYKSFKATIPQMMAMLHHKIGVIENIESKPVDVDQHVDYIMMVSGLGKEKGHLSGNIRILVLGPAEGDWV